MVVMKLRASFDWIEELASVCPDHYKIKFPYNSVTARCQGQGWWSAAGAGSSGSDTVSAQ